MTKTEKIDGLRELIITLNAYLELGETTKNKKAIIEAKRRIKNVENDIDTLINDEK